MILLASPAFPSGADRQQSPPYVGRVCRMCFDARRGLLAGIGLVDSVARWGWTACPLLLCIRVLFARRSFYPPAVGAASSRRSVPIDVFSYALAAVASVFLPSCDPPA